MTNFEAIAVLLKAANYVPRDTEGYAEALARAVWALSTEEAKGDG